MILVFILFFCIYLAGNMYIFIRGRQALVAQSFGVKMLLSVVFWSSTAFFLLCMLTRHVKYPAGLAHLFHEIGTGGLVFTFYMVLFLLAFDLFGLFNRKFNYGFYISLLLTLSLLSYGYYHYKHIKTQVVNIVINKAPESSQPPLKVVAISDIHLGYSTNKVQLRAFVEQINAEQPDLILIGGDLIDNSVIPLYAQQMQEELAQLKAPQGIYMVPGNHEYITGIQASIDFISTTPITLLRDTVVTLPGGLQIIGRDDRHNPSRLPLESFMQEADSSRPVILLDHQPYDLQNTQKAGVDLQFSGHTHRGQIWPVNLLTDHLFEQSYGYKQWGSSHIYVSSGLSLWGPPFRIGTNSEMVVFNITFGQS